MAEVDGGFGVSAAAQYSVILSVEWVYVSWTSECLRSGVRVGKSLDGFSAIVRTYSSGA